MQQQVQKDRALKQASAKKIQETANAIKNDIQAKEYPYVARSSKSLASTGQLLIDQYKDTSKLMLILCGSSMSYMEDHVLAYKAPLYGRRTAQMKILPFDFEETCRYFKNFTDEEKAYVYGIVGGTPQYLLQMSDKLSIEDNIKKSDKQKESTTKANQKRRRRYHVSILISRVLSFLEIGRAHV